MFFLTLVGIVFFLFDNNHKPNTYNIFGLLSHKKKNDSYEAA